MKIKKCSKCKKEYPATIKYFGIDNNVKDKLKYWCKSCKKNVDKIYSRKYREEHIEWKKENNKKNIDLVKKGVKLYIKKFPERYKANYTLRNMIKVGKVIREPCVICGNVKSHGHHIDYNKPLDVVWLCAKHHKAIHNNLLSKVELEKVVFNLPHQPRVGLQITQ